MKKILRPLLALMLVLMMALFCIACGKSETPIDQPEVPNASLPMRSATPAPEPEETQEPKPFLQPVSAPEGVTTVGNLLIHYPGNIEYAWDFASTYISFTPFADKSAFMQFSARSRKSAGWSFDEMIENGGMQEIIDGLKTEMRTTEVLDEGTVDMLGVTAYYFYHAHEVSGSTGYSKHYMFSDDEYNYQIFTFTSDVMRAQYEPAADEIVTGLNWGQLDHKIFADNYVTFHYPLRYLEWSSSSAADTDLLEELMKLVPENKSEDWVNLLESYLVAFFDTEGADDIFVPRIHVRLIDVPDATEETLGDPAVLHAIAEQFKSEFPDGTWHREMSLEQHGDKTFAVGILEIPDGKGMVMYEAVYVWNERMVVVVYAAPIDVFGDAHIAEMEALLASFRVAW
ncbi:hypothetical protein LJC07_03090 [Christensenellaceae bacterium OttesenSCG-928-L17]|nr:hypothetical protein [Christensenellaceae bacterium OttesenSCG-928-L17]